MDKSKRGWTTREIDEILKNHLHISIHSAGSFVNPKYSECSGSDPTIVEHMNVCMIHMGGDPCVQDLKKLQIEKYLTQKLLIEKHWTRQQTSGGYQGLNSWYRLK